MDFFPNTSFRTQNALYQVALCACCLITVMVGSMDGQTAPPPSTTYPDNQSPTPYSSGNPYGVIQRPSTYPVTGQGETDISSPRVQDRTQDRMQDRIQDRTQARLAPQPATPLPPTEFQRVVAVSTGQMVPIFGGSIFNSTPSTFAPVDNIPVTPDYVIGPGDELRLQIWGQVNQRGTFIVDRTGSISLPEVGTVHVAGLQFTQLSDFLKSQLGRVYRNFDLNVNLGQLRSIQVFVVGQARQPGSYTIGSLSTLLNALFASGGPLPHGSLRDIQIKRGGETITHFDLYDLLLRGDKAKDVRLQSGDVIFIPDVGPQVAVVGSISNPAIYELRGEKTFNQVIALAGGLTNVASSSNVRVERIDMHTERSVIEVDLASGESSPVQDGDIVNLTSIIDRFKDAVTLRGNVANPGRYAWHPGMRVSDLIPNRDAVVTRSYYRRLSQLGQSRSEYSGLSPDSYQSGQPPLPYENGQFPGSNQNAPSPNPNSNGRLQNLDAGNAVANSDYGNQRTEGSLGIQSGAAGDMAATRGTVGTSGGGSSVGAALTAGNANFGAKTDVLLSAPDIDWEYAVVERQSATDLTTSLLPFNLRKAVLDKDPAQDIEMVAGDVVTVFSKADIRVPSSQQTKFVKLEGEFVASGLYSVRPGETLDQLLLRAGGLTPDADLFASEFTRDTVRRLQRQRLLEYADALEAQITAATSASVASALTERDASAASASAASARAAVARLRQAQPTGRIVLQLKPDSAGIAAVPDLELQDGDRFVVPRTPATVAVQGQVYNANAFLYRKGLRVKDYLQLAGGPDRVGDRKREFILRADGSVVSHQYSNFAHHALFVNRKFADEIVFPGDTIIVPPIVQRGALLRSLSEISNVVEGFGLGAAAINVLR